MKKILNVWNDLGMHMESILGCLLAAAGFVSAVHGAGVDARGDTSLHRAMHNGRSNIERRIERASEQDLETKNKSGSTPLMSAVIWNHKKAVELLLARGNGQVNTVDIYGRTPLHYAAWLGLDDIGQILLDNGALPDIKDKQLQTALDVVRRSRHFLANKNEKESNGATPPNEDLK
jgi:ankyrin repeat protein